MGLFDFNKTTEYGANVVAVKEFKELSNKCLNDCINLMGNEDDMDIISVIAEIDETYVPLAISYMKLLNKSFELLEVQAKTLDNIEAKIEKLEAIDTKIDGLESQIRDLGKKTKS